MDERRKPFGRKEVLALAFGAGVLLVAVAALVVMCLEREVRSEASMVALGAFGALGTIGSIHQQQRGQTDRAEIAQGSTA